eukprot:PhF_6_TR6144/c0_g1_i1/m.9123
MSYFESKLFLAFRVFLVPFGVLMFGMMLVLAGAKYFNAIATAPDYDEAKKKSDAYNALGLVIWTVVPSVYCAFLLCHEFCPGNLIKKHLKFIDSGMKELGIPSCLQVIFYTFVIAVIIIYFTLHIVFLSSVNVTTSFQFVSMEVQDAVQTTCTDNRFVLRNVRYSVVLDANGWRESFSWNYQLLHLVEIHTVRLENVRSLGSIPTSAKMKSWQHTFQSPQKTDLDYESKQYSTLTVNVERTKNVQFDVVVDMFFRSEGSQANGMTNYKLTSLTQAFTQTVPSYRNTVTILPALTFIPNSTVTSTSSTTNFTTPFPYQINFVYGPDVVPNGTAQFTYTPKGSISPGTVKEFTVGMSTGLGLVPNCFLGTPPPDRNWMWIVASVLLAIDVCLCWLLVEMNDRDSAPVCLGLICVVSSAFLISMIIAIAMDR